MVHLKKKIMTGMAIAACVSLCAAVWTRRAEVGYLPAEPVKVAVTADLRLGQGNRRKSFFLMILLLLRQMLSQKMNRRKQI